MEAKTARLVRLSGVIGVILSIAGLLISVYLTYEHYTANATLACSESGIVNCAKVTTSAYSEILGIPLPLLGLLYFVAMLPLQLPVIWRRSEWWLTWGRTLLAISGIPFIFWLIYVELFKLNAICLYCTGVHILAFLLFAQVLVTNSIRHADTSPVSDQD